MHYAKEINNLARILSVWNMVEAGIFTAETGHRIIGQQCGYPDCCIEFFIKHYDNEDLTWVCMVDCNKLGKYVQCHKCWEEENQ